MICREIETVFDTVNEIEERLVSIDKGIARRLGDMERKITMFGEETEKIWSGFAVSESRIGQKLKDLKQRLIDLEEFTGAYNDNEFEDARTGDQIKADIKKRRQAENS